MRLGAYSGADGQPTLMQSPTALANWIGKTGAKPDVVMDYCNLGEPFPDLTHLQVATGIRGQMTIQLFQSGYGGETLNLLAIAQGVFDERIRATAAQVRNAAVRVDLRIAHEMNGDWYGWGAQPKNYIAAWRRIATVLRAEGIGSSKLIWCPNVFEPLKPYWPGDTYVDVVGLDGYNWGGEYNRTFQEVFGPDKRRVRQLTHRPIIVCETGCTENGKKGDWFNDAAHVAPKMFNEVTFFDRDYPGQRDWRVESSADALQGFRGLCRTWS